MHICLCVMVLCAYMFVCDGIMCMHVCVMVLCACMFVCDGIMCMYVCV